MNLISLLGNDLKSAGMFSGQLLGIVDPWRKKGEHYINGRSSSTQFKPNVLTISFLDKALPVTMVMRARPQKLTRLEIVHALRNVFPTTSRGRVKMDMTLQVVLPTSKSPIE